MAIGYWDVLPKPSSVLDECDEKLENSSNLGQLTFKKESTAYSSKFVEFHDSVEQPVAKGDNFGLPSCEKEEWILAPSTKSDECQCREYLKKSLNIAVEKQLGSEDDPLDLGLASIGQEIIPAAGDGNECLIVNNLLSGHSNPSSLAQNKVDFNIVDHLEGQIETSSLNNFGTNMLDEVFNNKTDCLVVKEMTEKIIPGSYSQTGSVEWENFFFLIDDETGESCPQGSGRQNSGGSGSESNEKTGGGHNAGYMPATYTSGRTGGSSLLSGGGGGNGAGGGDGNGEDERTRQDRETPSDYQGQEEEDDEKSDEEATSSGMSELPNETVGSAPRSGSGEEEKTAGCEQCTSSDAVDQVQDPSERERVCTATASNTREKQKMEVCEGGRALRGGDQYLSERERVCTDTAPNTGEGDEMWDCGWQRCVNHSYQDRDEREGVGTDLSGQEDDEMEAHPIQQENGSDADCVALQDEGCTPRVENYVTRFCRPEEDVNASRTMSIESALRFHGAQANRNVPITVDLSNREITSATDNFANQGDNLLTVDLSTRHSSVAGARASGTQPENDVPAPEKPPDLGVMFGLKVKLVVVEDSQLTTPQTPVTTDLAPDPARPAAHSNDPEVGDQDEPSLSSRSRPGSPSSDDDDEDDREENP